MKYNYQEALEAKIIGKDHYQVTFHLTRYRKAGEYHNGKKVLSNRCISIGRNIGTFYFDNEQEAFEQAEIWRKKILDHLKGKTIDFRNRGTSLYYPFTKKELLRNPLKWNDDDDYTHYHDYRFLEVLPFSYGISISYSPEY